LSEDKAFGVFGFFDFKLSNMKGGERKIKLTTDIKFKKKEGIKMKKKLVVLALGTLLTVIMSIGYGRVAAAATCTTTHAAGSDIQAAITAAAAGDVICLDPGLYSPLAKININKSVTLQGPQFGVDPRPSSGTTRIPGDTLTEAIIDGTAGGLSGIIVITADYVVLDGLQVRNGNGDLIDSESGTPTGGTILQYNIINNATGDEAIQLRAVTDGIIAYNHIFNIAQDGINMCCGSTGGTIQFNEVHDNSSENAAIYIYDADLMTIECNLVYDVYDNDGIKLGTKGGGDALVSGGSILYNTVNNTAQDGITVYTSDVTVEGNDVSYSSSENGAIYIAWAVSNITITENNVHDNTLNSSKWGDPGAIMIGTAVDAATVLVNNNNITGNSVNGVTNKAAGILDAEDNWWGAADGPSAVGPGSGDNVSTNVDFDPWLSSEANGWHSKRYGKCGDRDGRYGDGRYGDRWDGDRWDGDRWDGDRWDGHYDNDDWR
jgi:hypothetical protein